MSNQNKGMQDAQQNRPNQADTIPNVYERENYLKGWEAGKKK